MNFTAELSFKHHAGRTIRSAFASVFIAIATTTLLGGCDALEKQQLNQTLEEVSGVWTRDNAIITIKLDGEDKYIVFNQPSFLNASIDNKDEVDLVEVVGYDKDNSILSLKLKMDRRRTSAKLVELTDKLLSQSGPTQDDEPTLLRQIWDADHKTFNLTLANPGAEPVPLSFRRRLIASDLRQAEKTSVPPVPQPQAPAVAASKQAPAPLAASLPPFTGTAFDWKQYAGKFGNEMFADPRVREQLEPLFNGQFENFLGGLENSNQIEVVDDSYLIGSGCAAHLCTIYESLFILDVRSGAIFAMTTDNGKIQTVAYTPNMPITKAVNDKSAEWTRKF